MQISGKQSMKMKASSLINLLVYWPNRMRFVRVIIMFFTSLGRVILLDRCNIFSFFCVVEKVVILEKKQKNGS